MYIFFAHETIGEAGKMSPRKKDLGNARWSPRLCYAVAMPCFGCVLLQRLHIFKMMSVRKKNIFVRSQSSKQPTQNKGSVVLICVVWSLSGRHKKLPRFCPRKTYGRNGV